MRTKVFCIGMFKTGTTSIESLMRRYGFKTDGYFPTTRFWNSKYKDVFPNTYSDFKVHETEISNHIKKYDFFSDYPWMFVYEIVYKLSPNSKFILTTRDVDDVVNSSYNFERKMAGHNIELYGEDKLRKMYEKRFLEHDKKVRKFFSDKKDSLLVLDLNDNNKEQKICNFLNIRNKNYGFPHTNKT